MKKPISKIFIQQTDLHLDERYKITKMVGAVRVVTRHNSYAVGGRLSEEEEVQELIDNPQHEVTVSL